MKKVKKTKITGKRKFLSPATKIVWAVAFIGLVVLGVLYVRRESPAIDNAITLATTIKPETFTELYFEKHLSLPVNISYNQENKFAFTVHNLEYKTMTYSYEVYIKCSDVGCIGEKQIIDEGKITLKHDEYKTIPESFTLTTPTGRIEVVTNLINKNQQIDFWASGIDNAVQQTLSTATYQSQLTK